MVLQILAVFKQLSAVSAVVRSSVAVYATLMPPQFAAFVETFVAHRTLERSVPRVHSQVSLKVVRLTEGLVAHEAFVRVISAVKSAVIQKRRRVRKSFAANGTLE